MRVSAVAGQFYPGDKEGLRDAVSDLFLKAKEYAKETDALGGICAHAGYQYSGVAAATTYASIKGIKSADTIVIMGPNHTGAGSLLSLSLQDWETPLGVVKNDAELGKGIQAHLKILDFDERAHVSEHSIEVQLPFIQSLNPKAKIVPICMMGQELEIAQGLGRALHKAIPESGKKVVVIASSDFSHYIPARAADERDHAALSFITGMDAVEFENRVVSRGWSICGHGPIAALVEYAKLMKCRGGELLYYTNSGAYGGGTDSVVGYASVIFPAPEKKK
ncbi:MAG: AmmeMemoRadiSam system protein B [Candidatus ainarchaeum sp.]|nr:AmmeMemoRadiSam system protein B [Candidatus ainarchaeum sp.]